ncbi:helix-turn-helix domain-containing protein [Actinoplanes sp. NEAU-A11]|uniref:Helix-turn-helix domain-containing protein n=1 Tax=Actinoplanes aureus TaxID=2792083 RepID=A0A931G6T8_9ACTN|nr:helix-turn-helix domain-containing protein [Actinoplanes aureus]
MQDELLTFDEVAAILKIPTGTLRTWRLQGIGPTGFRVGKYVRFRLSAVEQFVAAKEAESDD